MSRKLLFHRDFLEYTGGQGKVWDYFNHVSGHADWTAAVYLTPSSVKPHNPWTAVPAQVEGTWQPGTAAALFLAGLDWSAYPTDDPARPVINLLQHVRHADPDGPLFRHLSRRAIRICVSQPVADAISATGIVDGPIRVIPAALDLAALPSPAASRHGIFIGATKQAALGRALAERLREHGRAVNLVDEWISRADYLGSLAACQVAVVLPSPTEGFFLPGIEAMALGCATIVPDCIGNREYLRADINALSPALALDSLVDAVVRLDDPGLRERITGEAVTTAARFSLEQERAAFRSVLDDIQELWSS